MIEELSNLLESFPGAANQTRCFTHVLNLVVKSVIRQFDLPKAQADDILDEATREFLEMGADLEMEGMEEDNVEGWVDERASMSEIEVDELEEAVQPVRILLTKVKTIDYKLLPITNC